MINSTKQNATLNNDQINKTKRNGKIKTLQMAQISVSNINNEYDNRWQCYTKNGGSSAVRKC
jgi:hypothetical protein